MLVVSYLRKRYLIQCHQYVHLCFLISFLVILVLTLKSLIHFGLISIYSMVGVQFHSFACGLPVVSTPVEWKYYSFPVELSWHSCLEFTINAKLYFWTLYICPYDSTTLFRLLQNFVVSSETRKCEPSNFALLFQDCFGEPGSCISIRLLGSACQCLQKSQLEFWWELCRICRSIWGVLLS